MKKGRHLILLRLLGTAVLVLVLLGSFSSDLPAQSPATPQAEDGTAPVESRDADAKPEKTPPAREEKTDADGSRSYRREKDQLKNFVPSEEIRVDKAVDFPADI